MSGAKAEKDAVAMDRLLAGAAKTIGGARYCWLATAAEDGFVNLRPMGRLPADRKDEWTIRFIADGRSRKVADMRRAGRVAIICQHDPDDAYVALYGEATLREGEEEIRKRWKDAYDVFFAGGRDRRYAAFVEVAVERMELWIRGVTPEPFGLRPTVLERDAGSSWRAVSQ
jgi:general stress protein 26